MDQVHPIGDASSGHDAAPHWMFFTNHFLVLACVAGKPDLRVRDISDLVGITERATQAILSDLATEAYLERTRVGRRNHYKVRRSATFRHPLVSGTTLGEVLDLVLMPGRSAVAR